MARLSSWSDGGEGPLRTYNGKVGWDKPVSSPLVVDGTMQNLVKRTDHRCSSCPSAFGRTWAHLGSLLPWNRAPQLPQELRMDRDRLFELMSYRAHGMQQLPEGAGPSGEIDALVGRLAGK